MTIYEHRTDVTASSGEVATTTLSIPGGILKNVYVEPNTATTVFKANLTDSRGEQRVKWGLTTCLNDQGIEFPMCGSYTFNITNASPDDTFTVILAVQEN